MDFSVMTYNLDYNTALEQSLRTIDKESPDILCLQEFNSSSENIRLLDGIGYHLIDTAHSRRRWNMMFGVATFFRNSNIKPVASEGINLVSGWFEKLEFFLRGGRLQRTILTSRCSVNGTELTIANIHLSPYSTNRLRDKQLHQTFRELPLEKNEPVIVLGDFNYPYNRSKFENIFSQYDLQEASTNVLSTFKSKIRFLPFIQFKLDYVLYKGLKHISTRQIRERHSDHMPLISKFKIG